MKDIPNQATKKRGLFIGALLAAMAVIIAGGIFAYLNFVDRRTTEEKLTDALFETAEAQRGEVTSVIAFDELALDMSDSDTAMIAEILRDMTLTSIARYDMGSRQIEGELDLEIIGTTLVGVDYYLDQEYLMLDVPLLHDQALYIRLEDLMDLMQGQMMDNLMGAVSQDTPATSAAGYEVEGVELQSAVDVIFDVIDWNSYESYNAIDQGAYKALIAAYLLEASKETVEDEEGISYTISYDQNRTTALLEDVMAQLADDAEAKEFIEEVINRFFDRVIEEKNWLLYDVVMGSSSDSLGWADGQYEADMEMKRADTLEGFTEGLADIENELDSLQGDSAGNAFIDFENAVDMDIQWHLDAENDLDQQRIIMDIDLSDVVMAEAFAKISIHSDLSRFKEPVTFKGVDFAGGIDVGSLDEEALMELFMEIQNNVFENMTNNPMFSDLFYLQ